MNCWRLVDGQDVPLDPQACSLSLAGVFFGRPAGSKQAGAKVLFGDELAL